MFRLMVNLFYGITWLVFLGIALLLSFIVLMVCAACPPLLFVVIGITIWLIVAHRKNLGVRGIQSIFPKFMNRPKGRITLFR